MKKFYFLLILIAVSLSSRSQLLTEPFAYTPDLLLGLGAQSAAGSSPWFIINSGDSILVDAASLTYPGLAPSTGNKVKFDASGTDYYTNFTSQIAGSVYRSFILNVSSLGGLTTTGGYFNGFIQSASTSLFGGTVWTRLSTTAGKYNVGVSTRSNSAATWLATDLTPGTPCFIVVAYDFNPGVGDDVARIWLNTAAIGGAEPLADATSIAGTDLTSVARVFLRQDNPTNTPFIEFDELRVGTTWLQVTPSGAVSPSLSATTLTGFGNVCTGTTAGPNTFTITGTALTAAPVTVGALSGFTYSLLPAGPYLTSLSLAQGGGAYSQTINVKFSPVAVQSYNGNIPVGGGGATSINVAATGSGINPLPAVTTGAASLITINSATLAGTATTACGTIISPYGIEYSTVNGFPNGTGTQANSGNLSGANFSSNVSGLASGTIYYYHAYATNGAGIAYGTQQSFTTLAPVLTATALTAFGNICIGLTVGPNMFTINGTNLTNAPVSVGPLSGFTFSTTSGGTYFATLSLVQGGGTYTQDIYVKFSPVAVQSYSGPIPVSGGGATAINVAASGAGINSIPTLTTGAASAITTTTATCAGTINTTGCTSVTVYGIEYSISIGFPNGTGTPVTSSNLSGGNFSSNLIGLSPNTTYYYHAYATNGGGTGYGSQQSFTTQALTPTLNISGSVAFGNVCLNILAGPLSFTINGSALTAAPVNVAALTGYTYSLTAGGTYLTTQSIPQGGGSFTQQIFVKFLPTIVQSYNGSIVVSGGGAPTPANASATGAGVNTAPSLTTGVANAITSISATCAGNNVVANCTAISAYGIEYSLINGFPNGTGTQVASGNLAGGNFTANLTGLTPTTTYYYKAYATNAGGTTWGSQLSFVTATPVLTAGALTAFGNVCTNTTAGPNSFNITGTNLSNANVSVGPLTGFTFSTTAAGTYTTTLSLPQGSGAYVQAIFVKFTPVAVQSYSGNIPVGGGGAVTINVAASGAGINTAATVNSGVASAITQISATVAGSIPTIGCTAITAYGIEYSLTNGFLNGTGIAVASTNLVGINFSSNLTGLIPSTTYYYHAYATNGGGTAYGVQGSFTTLAPVLTGGTLTAFGAICLNVTAGPNSFTITSNALLAGNINVGPLNGYSFATTANGVYANSLSLTQPGGGAAYFQTIYVKFTPLAVQSYNGNIPVNGGGAPLSINVFASGRGINTIASVTTGSATVLSPNAVTLNGSVTSIGCSAITAYGIEYSGISGLANGLGTKVPSSNISSGNFSSTLNGLVQGATYYYKAYAVNNGGTAYGAELSFTTTGIPGGYVIYSNPITRGGNLHFTIKGVKPGHYAAQVLNNIGQVIFQYDFIVQVNFIDENFTVPAYFAPGTYDLRVVNPEFRMMKRFMIR